MHRRARRAMELVQSCGHKGSASYKPLGEGFHHMSNTFVHIQQFLMERSVPCESHDHGAFSTADFLAVAMQRRLPLFH